MERYINTKEQEFVMTPLNDAILENMLSYLTEIYLSVDKYPHKIVGFAGTSSFGSEWDSIAHDVPCPEYSLTISSKEELYGRMKQLGQLLNAKAMTVTQGSAEITVELR